MEVACEPGFAVCAEVRLEIHSMIGFDGAIGVLAGMVESPCSDTPHTCNFTYFWGLFASIQLYSMD